VHSRRWLGVDNAALWALTATTVLIHLLCTNRYGYFRDELYQIACSKHLAWGYVDQPPFAEFVLAIIGRSLGYSQLALRLLPALCGGVITFMLGAVARQLGGGRFAQSLAATAYLTGGVYLALDDYYSMNCFDHLFWVLAIYLLVRILQGADTRLWILFGLVAGLGLENKYSMGFLGVGLVVGLALTPARRHFLDKWLWVGGALAAVLFLPHVMWEVHHHFPTAEFIRNATVEKNLPMTLWAFLLQSILMVQPATLPIWLAGLAFLFLSPPGRTYRVLGWIYLTVVAILLTGTNSKPYYLAPAFLLLLPAGAVAAETFLSRPRWGWVKPAYLGVLALGGVLLAPLALPILPVETLLKYQDCIGVHPGASERGYYDMRITQILADRLGWPEMTAEVAQIYNRLSPEEKAECVIGARNYGEAGAIDFFGRQYGLPNAISDHNNYWIWGPGEKPGTLLLVIGGSKQDYQTRYEDVQDVAVFDYPCAGEYGEHIFICRHPKQTLQQLWPKSHSFI
jgi:4-amino-4-deoxy-L-arabinose transferase-like glycosyltransferase